MTDVHSEWTIPFSLSIKNTILCQSTYLSNRHEHEKLSAVSCEYIATWERDLYFGWCADITHLCTNRHIQTCVKTLDGAELLSHSPRLSHLSWGVRYTSQLIVSFFGSHTLIQSLTSAGQRVGRSLDVIRCGEQGAIGAENSSSVLISKHTSNESLALEKWAYVGNVHI